MSDIPKDPELRRRYAEIQETRAKARDAARAADAFTNGTTRDKLAEAQAEVDRIEARDQSRSNAERLMQRRSSR